MNKFSHKSDDEENFEPVCVEQRVSEPKPQSAKYRQVRIHKLSN
jgi:hypothetical protein